MNVPKINSSLSVTVLAACLCLLAAGAPAGARRVSAASTAPSVSRAYVKLRSTASTVRELKLMGRRLSDMAVPESRTQENFYKNANSPAEIESVLVVTSLARASLPRAYGETA